MAHLFKIGDRCRVNFDESAADGKEGVIVAVNVQAVHFGKIYYGHHVDLGYKNPTHGNGRHVFKPEWLIPIQRRGDKLTAFDTTATDEATKAMLKAMSGEGVAA